MIRYPIHPAHLRDMVEEHHPGWLARAAKRTAALRSVGRYSETSGIWSDVKRPYMALQHFKCGFCERQLEKSQYGNIEHDVEHFRPKARVDEWSTVDTRGGADPGYYLLAYHLENYLISCKTCNTTLKRNYFPIADARDTQQDRTRELDHEKALLLYPISASDADPEDIITFRGIVPVPVGTRGHKRRRGEVTIRMFELDTRERLLQERAEAIVELHLAMALVDNADPLTAAAAQLARERLLSPGAAHANCTRAHHDLMLTDQGLANQFTAEIVEWLAAQV